ELHEQQVATFKNQQKEIERTEKLIDRFKAKASKASMAQSLMKKLDKIERVEVDEQDSSVMKLRFADAVQPGKIIFELHQISKSYGDQKVLVNINYQIDRGDRIAFVGQNGQGKSTLAKIMVEEIDFQGKLKRGHNVKIGYFAQNQSEYLDPTKTVLDTMLDAANDSNRIKVRDMLGAFLFRGDEVHKKVSVLSGGERNRLALCKMLLEPINTLIMDEPTNHLDLQSKQVLKDALKQYEGTLIVVSHDRDFLDGLTDKVLEFRNFKIKEYLGDINYFLEERAADNMRDVERKDQTYTKPAKAKKQAIGSKIQKKLQKKLSAIEQQIAQKEEQIKAFEQQIAQHIEQESVDFNAYERLKVDLEMLMADWEALAEQLD
ncbi:MAG: ATP-binding cassette domain-containing protein, partial [Flavobacteriaceae bacterium]|nr:ATP-binding cassette domain-containing protein [Flavobacteriaceae bacterium]